MGTDLMRHEPTESRAGDPMKDLSDPSLILRALIDGADEPIFSVDASYRYTSFNARHAETMKALYGADIELGHSILDYKTVAEDRSAVRDNLDRALRGERVVKETFFGSELPTRRLFTMTYDPIGSNGTVAGVVVRAVDITESTQAQERLRTSEDRFKHVFENSPVGKSFTMPDGEIHVNPAFCRMLGYAQEELEHTKWQDVTVAEDIELTQTQLDSIYAGKRDEARFEKRYRRRDGSVVWADVTTSLRRNEAGAPLYFVTVVVDITERKRAEERLAAAAEQWRATFDAMGDSVALFDSEGRIVRCNAATTALTGRGFAEILGRRCYEVFHGTGEFHCDCPQRRAFETRQAETCVIEQDGKWLHHTFTPQLDGAGAVSGGVHVVSDVTQMRHAEQAAAERAHFLEELLEAISVPVFYKDVGLHYEGCNQAFAQFVNRPKDEIVGATVFDLYPAGLATRFDASDRELLAHPEQSTEDAAELPGPDGSLCFQVAHKAVFSDLDGRPAGIIGVNLDVTEIRRAEQTIAASAAQLRKTLKGAVAALGSTTEMRDPYTAGHQRRVAELADAIAAELGWESGRLDTLRTAALLHDIGKIIVPTEILSKPGRLSEIEMELVRQHAAAGAGAVTDIDFEDAIAEMIRQHHERLDGSGYPQGLRGDEILPEARILAVADVVEAMVSHRPYRAALPLETALDEIESGAGSRFDAAVCEAALRLLREKRFSFSE